MNREEIKECPFCGNKATIKNKGTYGYDLRAYIICGTCGANMILMESEDYEEILIKRWNKRKITILGENEYIAKRSDADIEQMKAHDKYFKK